VGADSNSSSSQRNPLWKLLSLVTIVLIAFVVVRWLVGALFVALKWSLILGLVATVAWFAWRKLGGKKPR
jgi:hypothetical protein